MKIQVFVLLVAAMSFIGQPVRGEAEMVESEPGAASGAEAAARTDEAALLEEGAPGPPAAIARSSFTTQIVDREPQDSVTTLTNDHSKIFYFTELHNFEGSTVTHRWEFNGEPVAEVFFNVAGPRWRVFSSKNLPANATGEWTVSVVDETNQVLKTETFLYSEAPEAEPQPTTKEISPSGEAPAAIEEEGAETPLPTALQ